MLNPGIPLDMDWVQRTAVNLPAVKLRASQLGTRRTVKNEPNNAKQGGAEKKECEDNEDTRKEGTEYRIEHDMNGFGGDGGDFGDNGKGSMMIVMMMTMMTMIA